MIRLHPCRSFRTCARAYTADAYSFRLTNLNLSNIPWVRSPCSHHSSSTHPSHKTPFHHHQTLLSLSYTLLGSQKLTFVPTDSDSYRPRESVSLLLFSSRLCVLAMRLFPNLVQDWRTTQRLLLPQDRASYVANGQAHGHGTTSERFAPASTTSRLGMAEGEEI